MIEKALKGGSRYWLWIGFLFVLIIVGFLSYLKQLAHGLGITGMGRDVSWGLYIANFTFFVGVAASAVVVVLPYYIHDYKRFKGITILGEFLAISAVIMTILFIFVDLGAPSRVLNIILYPSPSSLLFWDMVVLTGYLILNIIIGWWSLDAEDKEMEQPRWIRPLVYISIPWAISIHTVTAFIYSGLIARSFWHTALLAPRFLASAFASGPSLLIILSLIAKRWAGLEVERDAIKKVSVIIAYALAIHIFFVLVEIFTVFYGDMPAHTDHFRFLFLGVTGKRFLVPWAWGSVICALIAFITLLKNSDRLNEKPLVFACILTILSIWAEKGIGLVIAGFIPTPLDEIPRYYPTLFEVLICIGIYATGFLVLTVLYKIAASIRGKNRPFS
ncbi:MAG TPA: polysulfide reductase NrfD [Syntrophorhabdaceae bacterium]|nr:polysulfide reductase NrfD [Syntrophorhabdaceae bacterium]HOL04592.1 polysulfide reductase NrfD [Syntrophorhabdaceae bacterium]HON85976.1 polysulfide reductase NrfD [Syntrophorhabdaceae bacterium]HOT41719.1 polysulfide reductase NrfD [Syntrophorhabdaceae bacterium]HPC67334.1 polysulfide reductase NrfD [Syntrophorhabdaceae bacterium]